MDGIIDLLIRWRDEMDALIVGLTTIDPSDPDEPVPDVPKGKEDCEHKNTQTIQGAGQTPERTVCVDCMKEL